MTWRSDSAGFGPESRGALCVGRSSCLFPSSLIGEWALP